MYLSPEEEKMLKGESGDLAREAMRYLVKLGDAFDAKRMIDIDYSYCFVGTAYWGPGSLTKGLLKQAVNQGVRVKVPTTNWNYGFEADPGTQRFVKIPPAAFTQLTDEARLCRKFGIVPVNTCTPYLATDISWHPLGSHISSVESSAITYFNSVLGARTNRDGMAAFFSAITGKYPEFGLHLDENRVAKYLFNVSAKLENATDYSALGYAVGKICGLDIPILNGIHRAKTGDLKALSTALSTGGGVPLFHIPGITPEFTASHRTDDQGLEEKLTITSEDVKAVYEEFSSPEDKVDFVCLGCPHSTVHELSKIASLLRGKKVNKRVTLWIMASPQTISLAKLSGDLDIIQGAGGVVLTTCPMLSPGKPGPFHTFSNPDYSMGNLLTDSAKMAYYSTNIMRPSGISLCSLEGCIDGAIRGRSGG